MSVVIKIFLLVFIFLTCSNINRQVNPDLRIGIDTIFNFLPENYKSKYLPLIEKKIESILLSKRFNGQILIAKNGQPLYENYIGYSDFKNKIPMDTSTPIQLASISKTFTAMSILKLMEEHKLNLDDDITKFFPNFPYKDITVRYLLCHRTGLPDYEYFFEKYVYKTTYKKNKYGRYYKVIYRQKTPLLITKDYYDNYDVLNYITKFKPRLKFKTNTRFDYCNTNYVLLALIIEKVSGQTYPNFIKDNIFIPLGMKNSFVVGKENRNQYLNSYYPNNKPFSLKNIDFIYGEKNVFSTVEDLLIWDKYLYSNGLLSQQSIQLAFTPHNEPRNKIHNYGLGWRLILNEMNEKIVYHNGWWHGNNTVFTRFIQDTITVIVLGNRYNKQIYKSKSIHDVFTGVEDSTSHLE